MSYHLYHTHGIVLGGANIGESNRYYYIFTRDLGLVTAFAQGARELKSKLRGHLSDFAYASLDLIRGKDAWRVTGAEKENRLNGASVAEGKRALLFALAKFLRRFLRGEEENRPLFEELRQALSFLHTAELSPEELRDLELLLVARFLHRLGYWGGNGETLSLFGEPFSKASLARARTLRLRLLAEVNRSLKESHL